MDKRRFGRLLYGSANGNAKAFEELYGFFYPKIVFYVLRRYGDMDAAIGVARDFFSKLTDPDFNVRADDIEHPGFWIYAVCADFIKERLLDREPEETVGGLRHVQDAPDASAIISAELIDALGRLKPLAREIVLMNDFEGFSLKEISAELAIMYPNVRQKYARSLRKIEAALAKTSAAP